jgi:hypothetical protein
MDRNSKRRGTGPLVACILILIGATSMQGFENIRVPLILVLFFAGVNAGVALMYFLGRGNRHQGDDAGPPLTNPK